MAHGKPAPDVYLTVAARLGIKPDRGASVEASGNGLRSAAAAGMYIIAVPSPRYPATDPDVLALASVFLRDLSGLTPGTGAALG